MNPVDYYQSHKDYFWIWEENFTVLSIPDGSTIAFTQQVEDILTELAKQGLPPFGSLLLAIAATNQTMDDSISFIEKKLGNYLVKNEKSELVESEFFPNAFDFLRQLQQIPDEYKSGRKRQILFQTIFRDAHNKANIKTSVRIVLTLKSAYSKGSLLMAKEFNDQAFFRDFRVISLLKRKFPTSHSIIKAMEDLPDFPDNELPETETPLNVDSPGKDFVEQLIDNSRTFDVGTLIKPIWAGFKIPIFNAHPSEQPLGGISDLSNKGDFDKLLVSEFANDDLTFMSRLANNEAIYLHREMPPIKDKLQRVMLIDISLKMWGTPKILAHATYLAIARHPKSLSESLAFVVGNQYEPVYHHLIGDVIDGLDKVKACLHPADGLSAFLKDHKTNKQLEIFYLTTSESLKYPDVQKVLAEYPSAIKYIVTTDQEGEINFYRNKNKSQKHLQKIKLTLNKVSQEKGQEVKASDVNIPLLVSSSKEIKNTFPLGNNVYCIAHRCLLKLGCPIDESASKGWEVLLRDVPSGGFYEVGLQENNDVLFLCFNPQNRELSITNLRTLQVVKGNLKSSKIKGFVYKTDSFIYISSTKTIKVKPVFDKEKIILGDLGSHETGLWQDLNSRQKQIGDLKISTPKNILKNVTTVFCDDEKRIFFNGHFLKTVNNHLFLSVDSINRKARVSAQKTSFRNQFRFKEGSTISIDANGCFILKSSDIDFPVIYVTSTLDMPLGMSTHEYFAGNPFFYNEVIDFVNIEISDIGPHKMDAVRIIKTYSGLGLADAKNIVGKAPGKMSAKMSFANAEKMVSELRQIGSLVKITSPKKDPLKIIPVEVFYQKYIAKFIDHILYHETKN